MSDQQTSSPTGAQVALEVAHVSKSFVGTRALENVSFQVQRGHIHALMGGNGSGKSTLIKIMAGIYHGEPGGTITVDGKSVASDHTTPGGARHIGLHFVHQNPAVFGDLSVAENLAVGNGFDTTALWSIKRGVLKRRTQALIERFDIHATPDTLLRTLRPAERAMVAIARALQDQEGETSGVLVLDEPTASLPRAEVIRLMLAIERYAKSGQTILFVSHRLDEVIESADAATVLRDGELAGSLAKDEITEPNLIELIAGRPLDRMFPEMPEVKSDETAVEAKSVAGGPLRDVSFRLRRGEVLGIAGLLGSGRSELLKMIFGAYPVRGGTWELDGRPVDFGNIGEAMRAGVAYVPEDRHGDAAFPDMTLSENLTAATVDEYWRRLRLTHGAADADARESVRRFFIRSSSEKQRMSTLSGGNQQKVILARWLRRNPKVLLLDEPTQGVDVNARAEIYSLVHDAVEAGTSVLLVTSDFEELAHVSDRVIVLSGGRIVAEVNPPDIDPMRLTELAFSTTTGAAP